MTAALSNTAGGTPFAVGVDSFVYPQMIGYANRAPTSQDVYNPGTRWQDNSVTIPVIYQTSGAGRWAALPTTPTVISGASPQISNNRSGQVTFTGVSIAAGATQSFVINNTTISAVGTVILYEMTGATAGSALTIASVTNVAGTSSTIVVTNGTGATTNVANLTFTYIVLS